MPTLIVAVYGWHAVAVVEYSLPLSFGGRGRQVGETV